MPGVPSGLQSEVAVLPAVGGRVLVTRPNIRRQLFSSVEAVDSGVMALLRPDAGKRKSDVVAGGGRRQLDLPPPRLGEEVVVRWQKGGHFYEVSCDVVQADPVTGRWAARPRQLAKDVQRRRAQRVRVELAAKVQPIGAPTAFVTVVDLSRGGMRCVMDPIFTVAKGMVVTVKFVLEGTNISSQACVAHTEAERRDGRKDTFGLEFVSLAGQHGQLLDAYCMRVAERWANRA